MFHLFDRKYISLDALGLYNLPGDQRIYITDASFSVPLVADASLRTVCGIIGYYQNLQEVDNALESRAVFWKNLIADDRSISIIASPAVMAELMIQFWKSVFAKHTLESLHLLYTLYSNHDNSQAFSDRLKAYNSPDGTTLSKQVIPILTKEEFEIIYKRTEPIELLEALTSEQISFEHQLMAYMAGTKRSDVRGAFFKKLDRFASKYLAQSLIDTASEIIETSSTLDLQDENVTDPSLCPLCILEQVPQYQWIFSRGVFERDVDKVLRDFGLVRIAKTMQDLDDYREDKLFTKELPFLYLLAGKQYDEMVKFDIERGAVSFFALKSNRTKVNSLLISYLYRLQRQGKFDELKMYELK